MTERGRLDVFEKVNWANIDDNKIVGSNFPMPDGSKHYIEMSMLHWYWAHFIIEKTELKLEQVAQDALDVIAQAGVPPEEGEFDDLIRIGLMSFGKAWVKSTTGRG